MTTTNSTVEATRATPAAVPGATAAITFGTAAVQRVLSGYGENNQGIAAAALLRDVEAQIRAVAPPGMSAAELSAAAARLVERQGLSAQLAEQHPFAQPAVEEPAVDTRL